MDPALVLASAASGWSFVWGHYLDFKGLVSPSAVLKRITLLFQFATVTSAGASETSALLAALSHVCVETNLQIGELSNQTSVCMR